jgi:Transposase DDE domain
MMLVQSLWDYLRASDVLLGDRGFCSWGLLAQCLHRNVHAVFRIRGSRRGDFRRGRHLSKHERLVRWEKPRQRPKSIPEQEWLTLPQFLDLRLVRCSLQVKGFRTTQVLLVTTLLDRVRYPLGALAELYLRRWKMELTLRSLKSTLQMEHLSCVKPENVERELRMHLLAHNLVRRLMLEAARVHGIALSRVSFAGALAACRRFGEAMLQTASKRKRKKLFDEMIRLIAEDPVPERPGRREPRALKRRNKPYPLLTSHRRRYREISHKNTYWGRRKRK